MPDQVRHDAWEDRKGRYPAALSGVPAPFPQPSVPTKINKFHKLELQLFK